MVVRHHRLRSARGLRLKLGEPFVRMRDYAMGRLQLCAVRIVQLVPHASAWRRRSKASSSPTCTGLAARTPDGADGRWNSGANPAHCGDSWTSGLPGLFSHVPASLPETMDRHRVELDHQRLVVVGLDVPRQHGEGGRDQNQPRLRARLVPCGHGHGCVPGLSLTAVRRGVAGGGPLRVAVRFRCPV